MSKFLNSDNKLKSKFRRSFDGIKPKSAATNKMKLHRSTDNLTSPLRSIESPEYPTIESEYIKNLQQQIYFLELETEYLREQAHKSSGIEPQMKNDLQQLLQKLRDSRTELDGTKLEVVRKDSHLSLCREELQKLKEKIKSSEDAHLRDRRSLLDEIIQLKKERVTVDKEISRKDDSLESYREECEKYVLASRNAELTIGNLKSQLEHRIEQQKLMQISLDESRADLDTAQTQLKNMELKYYGDSVDTRFHRHQEIHDGNVRSERPARVADYLLLQDNVKQLTLQLEMCTRDLERQKANNQELNNQLSIFRNTDVHLHSSQTRVNELEHLVEKIKVDNDQLMKDKLILVDHISDLQKQITAKEDECRGLQDQLSSPSKNLISNGGQDDLEMSVQEENWKEFTRLAESMQKLSASMIGRRSSNQLPATDETM